MNKYLYHHHQFILILFLFMKGSVKFFFTKNLAYNFVNSVLK